MYRWLLLVSLFHFGQPGQPTIDATMQACLDVNKVYYPMYDECFTAGTTGPCQNGEWIVLQIQDGVLTSACQPRPCHLRDIGRPPINDFRPPPPPPLPGRLNGPPMLPPPPPPIREKPSEEVNKEVECPPPELECEFNQRLHYDPFGDPLCECIPGYFSYKDRCEQEGSPADCPDAGSVLALIGPNKLACRPPPPECDVNEHLTYDQFGEPSCECVPGSYLYNGACEREGNRANCPDEGSFLVIVGPNKLGCRPPLTDEERMGLSTPPPPDGFPTDIPLAALPGNLENECYSNEVYSHVTGNCERGATAGKSDNMNQYLGNLLG